MARLSHREKLKKELKNPPEEDPEFQIAPMIDILLVLLVFFMSISSTEVLQSNKEVILPVAKDGKDAGKGKHPGQVIVNITWLEITNLGGIEVDDVRYAQASEIVPRLQRAVNADPLCRVLIRADRAVRYEFLRNVMKAVGEAGVSNVTFSVVDKDPNAS